ncbi:hypothetical protein ANI_1_2624014 [Paecilomyces variotii No. 5]|uniref:Glyoxalase-like domain-containing protein n=1 Tax=Byssochlamys spectabilis (strain No. 5 / NBRC 109023) TaxID=1356009 RepID=V5I441_BYSSN|nr:hypothetical protein ANI_1_2624014 [Paecilomyces variotii No. 5]
MQFILPISTLNSQLTPHPGGSSRNKLIVFKDGTLLELFNFYNPPTEFTHWKDKPDGLIDFAMTTLPPVTAEDVHGRITQGFKDSQLEVTYEAPKKGGRVRKDGQQVAWQTTRPISIESVSTETSSSTSSLFRTDLPFFCHDVTPRQVRVPFDNEEITTHPCGAVGTAAVEVVVPEDQYDAYIKSYSVVLGAEPRKLGAATDGAEFLVGSPVPVGIQRPRVWVHAPRTAIDEEWVRERGASIRSFTVAVDGREGHGSVALGGDGVASTIRLEWG